MSIAIEWFPNYEHLMASIFAGLVVTPLEWTNGTGWTHSVVMTAKKWSEIKLR